MGPQVIWIFAGGTTHDDTGPTTGRCPCDGGENSIVGENYFCEAVIDDPNPASGTTFDDVFFGKDILWDESGCTSSGDCCSRFTGPYFIRHLDSPTSDDIDIFICNNDGVDVENFAIELIEIYVK